MFTKVTDDGRTAMGRKPVPRLMVVAISVFSLTIAGGLPHG